MQGSWKHTKGGIPRAAVKRPGNISEADKAAIIAAFLSGKDNTMPAIVAATGLSMWNVTKTINQYLETKKPK